MNILALIGSAVVALLATVFGFRQRDKRKSAEKALEKNVDTTRRQQVSTSNAMKEVVKEKRQYEKRKKEEIPAKVDAPSSINERLDRLRKQ